MAFFCRNFLHSCSPSPNPNGGIHLFFWVWEAFFLVKWYLSHQSKIFSFFLLLSSLSYSSESLLPYSSYICSSCTEPRARWKHIKLYFFAVFSESSLHLFYEINFIFRIVLSSLHKNKKSIEFPRTLCLFTYRLIYYLHVVLVWYTWYNWWTNTDILLLTKVNKVHSLGFIVCVIHSVGFDKYVMTSQLSLCHTK